MTKKDETIAELYAEIGKRLHERRKQLRLTQEQLAEKTGVSAQMISSAERGQKGMMPENVIKISRALNVSTDYLLCGNTGVEEVSMIFERVDSLEACQLRHLETIINSFIDAVTETKT